ncbi:MAG: hypothetical protein MZV65_51955 [Chromatiales bacterium]|nr:hypothetical protein [Chromatiales bacterium]
MPYVEIVQGGADPGAAVLRHRVLDGAPRGRPHGPASACQGRAAPTSGRRCASAGTWCCRWSALVFMLFSGYTPLFAGTIGLALTVVLILGAALAARLRAARRCASLFWVLLGLALLPAFRQFGVVADPGR